MYNMNTYNYMYTEHKTHEHEWLITTNIIVTMTCENGWPHIEI